LARGRKPNSSTKKISVKSLVCVMCGEDKKASEYYQSYNPLHQTGKLPYCKQCLKNMCLDSKGNMNIENFKKMLQTIDRPFLYDIFKISAEDNSDTVGTYMKNIAMRQYKDLKWINSSHESNMSSSGKFQDIPNISFQLTPEIIMRWGNKYEDTEDYIQLENFYNDMKISNNIETAQDIVYLKKLSVISLKMDKALQESNSSEAKQLGDLFSKYMADSKFRAMDKTEADKTGGIRNFAQIYAEVEKDGFIPPWEYYRKIKGISQDIVDKVIMHIENFTLKLNKVEKMTSPPIDTPKLEEDEIDNENIIKINDIEVDEDFEDIDNSDEVN
jgi:hypothetical protein